MKKANSEDGAFKRRVAEEFEKARERARQDHNLSVEQFAATLGVTKAAYYKYVNKQSMPSLRVLKKARKWGVRLSYPGLGDGFIRTAKADPRQMTIQFSGDDVSAQQIKVKRFSPKGDKALELVIHIDLTKSA
jgi:transcriptional regulator with XRE-family HTH domain